MDVDKSKISNAARTLGADDIFFAAADENEGDCIIVLFYRYYAASDPQNASMPISPYYAASNKGYHAAKKLTEYLGSLGAKALHNTTINAKMQALKVGGHIGRNGFYYHPDLGSLVNIQTIVTDCTTPDAPMQNETKCLDCGACIKACPSDAVGNVQNCLRYHSNTLIPNKLRGDVYQLLGCERCQTACPQNSTEQRPMPSFDVAELLCGKHVKEIKSIAGNNMARANRLLSQAALYAANTHQTDTKDHLQSLTDTAPSPVSEHALWAATQLRRKK